MSAPLCRSQRAGEAGTFASALCHARAIGFVTGAFHGQGHLVTQLGVLLPEVCGTGATREVCWATSSHSTLPFFPLSSQPSRSFLRYHSNLARLQSSNLPGWRWATIKQVALDRLSRSLHSDVCDSDGCCDAVLHSTISGREGRRERAALNISSSIRFRFDRFRFVDLLRFAPVAVLPRRSTRFETILSFIPSRPFGYDQV